MTLGLAVLQQDPDWTVFVDPTQLHGAEFVRYIKTGRISLQGNFEEYWASRGKDLAENLRTRRRRLERQGIEVRLVANREPSQVAQCIEEYGRLEETGWKGKAGTAVSASNTQGLFYQQVLENFSHQGESVIYWLKFNNKTVAGQLCLERNGMMIFLKTAYDEHFRRDAPGYLLRQEILRTLFQEERVHVVEFYGRARDGWTTKWTSELREMFHINLFRFPWLIPVGRAVRGLAARVAPTHAQATL
jgi:hypothetical protein